MKKALAIIMIGIVGIMGHMLFRPDAWTQATQFVAAQVAQVIAAPGASSPSPAAPAAPSGMSVPDSTLIALVISGIVTLIYAGYTSGTAFHRKP